jgi:hypothetical protein
MATTTCAKCGNGQFEIQVHEFPGSAQSASIVQCSRCGAPVGVVPVGVVPGGDTDNRLASLEQAVRDFAVMLRQL